MPISSVPIILDLQDSLFQYLKIPKDKGVIVMRLFFVYVIFAWALISTGAYAGDFRTLQYDGFELLINCDLRAAVSFSYTIGPDFGKLKRRSSFSLDPNLSPNCQQKTGKSYRASEEPFDRGQLVPANHLDHLKRGIYQSNYMTNILPQARNMNRGAWLRTEEIIECYREIETLKVSGGPLYDTNRDRDYFIESHGVRTPSAYWKVVIGESRHIAWIIPNSSAARRSKLDQYLVSISDVETQAGQHFQDIGEYEKNVPATRSWEIPGNCDLS